MKLSISNIGWSTENDQQVYDLISCIRMRGKSDVISSGGYDWSVRVERPEGTGGMVCKICRGLYRSYEENRWEGVWTDINTSLAEGKRWRSWILCS